MVQGDGATATFDAADLIYVSAGVTHPAAAWLDGLADGGRRFLPLTMDENRPATRRTAFDPSRMMRTGIFFSDSPWKRIRDPWLVTRGHHCRRERMR